MFGSLIFSIFALTFAYSFSDNSAASGSTASGSAASGSAASGSAASGSTSGSAASGSGGPHLEAGFVSFTTELIIQGLDTVGVTILTASPAGPPILAPIFMLIAGNWIHVMMIWTNAKVYLMPARFRMRYETRWPETRIRTPFNIEFVIHRYNEFIMLMIGETILSLIIADSPNSDSTEEHYAAFISGFIIIVALLHGYQMTEPHHANEHVLRRSMTAGMFHGYSLMYKALATVLIGISFKLILIAPIVPDTSTHRFLMLNQLLVASITVALIMQFLVEMLHVGYRAYYAHVSKNKEFLATFILSLILMVGAWLPNIFFHPQPWLAGVIQCLFVVAQWALAWIEVYRIEILSEHGSGQHSHSDDKHNFQKEAAMPLTAAEP